MKHKSAFTVLIIIGLAMLPSRSIAQKSSIQIMEPSTSKIEVIGTKKKISHKSMIKDDIEKLETSTKPVIQARPVAVKPVTAKPAMPRKLVMPQLRTGEAELPVVKVNEIKNK